MSAHERASGLTLHRSDVHAQLENDTQDAKERHLSRRGRREGFASKPIYPFKPLGAPVDNAQVAEMATSRLAKVEKARSRRGGDADRADDWPASKDEKDVELGLPDERRAEQGLGVEEAQQELAHIPQQGLFGKDLRRCQCRAKEMDGLRMLREFVHESENRVLQVKASVPGTVYGLDDTVSMLDYLMPPRKNYPPALDKRLQSARGTIRAASKDERAPDAGQEAVSAPASARDSMAAVRADGGGPKTVVFAPMLPAAPRPDGPGCRARPPPLCLHTAREAERRARNCPGRPEMPQAYNRQVYVSPVQHEMRPRPLPIKLPSLHSFIASSEPAMGGRSERGEISHLREMINELLGLPRQTALKLPQEELAGVRRGRTDFKRKIEKQLDTAWTDRAFLKRCVTAVSANPGEEGKGAEPERANGSTDVAGPQGVEEVVGGTHDGGDMRRKRREWTESEEAEAYTKVVALLREPDPTISPVARMRSTLRAYQSSREKHRGHLQSALYSMDADRLNSLKRRAQHLEPSSLGPQADAKTACQLMRLEAERDMLAQHLSERMKRQYTWYRDLWYHVQSDKRDLPNVAHFIFDFVKQVLEYGEVFQKSMYFAMLEQIEDFEFSAVIAGLVVEMVRGIDDLTVQDLIDWFWSHRGAVPLAIADLTGRQDHPGKAGGRPLASPRETVATSIPNPADLVAVGDAGASDGCGTCSPSKAGGRAKNSLAFMTEVT